MANLAAFIFGIFFVLLASYLTANINHIRYVGFFRWLRYEYADVKSYVIYIRDRYLTLTWYRLWIRENEFHPSLDYFGSAQLHMNKKDRAKFVKDLELRRSIAHERGDDVFFKTNRKYHRFDSFIYAIRPKLKKLRSAIS